MFTGIIDHYGVIERIEHAEVGLRLWVRTQFSDLQLGESIAIDGICLTVTSWQPPVFSVDISPETGKLTTAADFAADQQVNLERALLPTDRLGGHFVMGHVDGVAKLQTKQAQGDYIAYQFGNVPAELMQYICQKGSIAVNGVSLTINQVHQDGFSVMLIPHSLQRTNLGGLQPNDIVNIEVDYLARIVISSKF